MSKAQRSELPDIGFIRLPTVLRHFPVSKSTWFQGVKDGRFPAPVKLSDRIAAYKVEEIRQLIDATAGK